MKDAKFEWDERKATANAKKHDISFESARLVFNDFDALDEDEPDPDEARFVRIGVAEGRVLAVIYTERGERIRIISARPATREEQRRYHGQD